MLPGQPVGAPSVFTAAGTTTLRTGPGIVFGFFVASGTTVTVSIFDNTTNTGTPILATFTAPANGWFSFPVTCATGITVVIGGTAPNVTVVWMPS